MRLRSGLRLGRRLSHGWVVLAALACSAGPPGGGRDRGAGTDGSGQTGSGSGASSGVSTAVGSGGLPPMVDIGNSGGSGGTGGMMEPEICQELQVTTTPVVPTVLVLVDNSTSMFEPREELWDALHSSLMDPATGVVAQLQTSIRFGFASYKGFKAASETDPACAEITSVSYALNNHGAIDMVYTDLGTQYDPGTAWETPTGHAVTRVTAELNAFTADPPGPKFILLVTDGNPNTCVTINPNCGHDIAIRAVQEAYALGIRTIPVGIGEIVVSNGNDGCNREQVRCGVDHLQDMANAGAGQPVINQPPEYVYQPCVAEAGGTLTATYSATSGTAPYYTAVNSTELQAALEASLINVVSCTFDMDAVVTGDASLGQVTVAGQPVTFSDPNGWTLEENAYQVTLNGTACEQFREGNNDVRIAFPCDPVTGEPVATPRIR